MVEKDPVPSQDVYNALRGAVSQQATVVKASTDALHDYVGRPGTYNQLYSIAAEKASVPLDVRRMAIIQFKNGALGVWKNKRLFTNESRAAIRAKSMTFLQEEDNTIADCNALIVAKIARIDFPNSWPSLVADLTATIQDGIQNFLLNPIGANPANTLPLKRTLGVLDRVIKELSSIKLLNGIKVMAQLADALYSPLISHYDRLSGLLRASLSPEAILDPLLQGPCGEVIELSHMIFKPCVKVMLWLWQKSGQKEFQTALETLSVFAQSCFQLARGFFDLRVELVLALRRDAGLPSSTPPTLSAPAAECLNQLTRHLRLYGKMFRRMQQLNIRKFILIPQANELVQYYWGEVVKATSGPPDLISDSPVAVYPVRLLVQGMVLFRESLAAWSNKEKSDSTLEILSEQFVREAVQILLTRFIPLSSTDLDKWMIDPEEWINEEEKEGDQWEFDIRPCSERVLMTLCNHYQAYVVPLLLRTLDEVLASPPEDLSNIIRKEAVYCAIGRCANRLQEKLDFDDLLRRHLIVEAQKSNPDYRIIKRRIAWLIGKWHSGQYISRSKTQVWEILQHLICDRGASSDPVVRLSAAEAINQCIDSVDFELQTFVPFLGSFVAELLRLVIEADTVDSKKRLIKTLHLVVECAGTDIIPFMAAITSPLPQLWQDSGEDYILKALLMVLVTNLVQAARENSASLSHIVISLVQESSNPSARLHLDEDGLILWQTALRSAVTLDVPQVNAQSYTDMFPYAVTLIADNLDLLGTVLSIVQSYILLDAPKIIITYGQEFFNAFAKIIPRALHVNVKEILLTIQLITRIMPPLRYGEAIHRSGLFPALVKAVIDDKSPAPLLAEHIYVFARIALWDPVTFNQLIVASAPSLDMPETQVVEGVLDQWWSKFDTMAEPQHRKLAAMGIAAWVSTARTEVLDRLHTEIFNIWLDVFGELKEAIEEESLDRSPLKMFWLHGAEQPPPMPHHVEGTVEENRWRQLHLEDPMITQKLTTFIKEKLQQAEVNCGGTEIFRAKYLEKADPTVLSQLMKELMSGN